MWGRLCSLQERVPAPRRWILKVSCDTHTDHFTTQHLHPKTFRVKLILMFFHPHIQVFFFPFYLKITLMDITPWASLIAQLVNNLPAMRETGLNSGLGKIPWRRERLPTPVLWPGGFPGLYSPWGHTESDRLSHFHFHFLSQTFLLCKLGTLRPL